MTYSSLSLRRYPAAVSDVEMETYSTESERVIDLAPFSNRLFPHEAAAWGRDRGLQAHFADNEWVRIVIRDSVDLADLAQRIGAWEGVGRLIAEVDLTLGQIVVEAEAF